MAHAKANMWRRQNDEIDTRPPSTPVVLVRHSRFVVPPKGDVSVKCATGLVEYRFGRRADKAIRKFSWETAGDGGSEV